ncbi:3-isopropylmalate dehydratase [miscellaneous Crenarchaeota group-15 archaeon DG-45]|uniref:3-isopropylmalate dehydratase small subunit n=1 Tax=miscellaneous Crenarchaeota group-15 archaeon DG-45 TaxID=1685127 RepID=A0A0M0BLU6_9ARCH|nr:MAG: 3-isopropylmalate dehydratase [miscellaneous Crenarchaeota group-15 archaeon DG-45]
MKLRGRAWRFGDDVNTDLISPGRYLELTDPLEMARHAMEGIDPSFPERVSPGDIVVAGRNFGLGSSREHAPLALKHAGVGAVVAESFARIFYRNAINIGLPALECRGVAAAVGDGDTLEIDLSSGSVVNVGTGARLRSTPLPEFMLAILSEGGLTSYLRRHMDEWLS